MSSISTNEKSLGWYFLTFFGFASREGEGGVGCFVERSSAGREGLMGERNRRREEALMSAVVEDVGLLEEGSVFALTGESVEPTATRAHLNHLHLNQSTVLECKGEYCT